MRTKIMPAISSKQRMLQPSSHYITVAQTVSLEGTQDEKTQDPGPR